MNAPDDLRLQPGDGGLESFERRLPENCVEYMLFVIDSQLDSHQVLASLEAIRKEALQRSEKLAGEYIWQRDEFRLEVVTGKGGLLYLHGRTDFGDCIEDEWLIVYMLRELTKGFANLWARVFDSDGEFLLVEAASVLPKWLSPETDAHRVWIHGGHLSIIPQGVDDTGPETTAPAKKSLSLLDAVSVIRSKAGFLTHSPFIEAEAFYRLEKYPAYISESLHHTKVTIPRKLAYILHDRPRAIAPAAEAFYLRDAVSLKPLFAPDPAGLTFPPTDLVTVSVKFNRVLFARLKSQHFAPPPPAWRSALKSAERDSVTAGDESGERARKRLSALETSIKLTTGFELLAARAEIHRSRVAREVDIVLQDLREDGDAAALILPTDAEIATWPGVGREDDEAWLDIDYGDFERELDGRQPRGGVGPNGRASTTPGGESGFGDAKARADLRKMVERFKAFLNDKNAGIEGAEIDKVDEDDDEGDEGEGDEDDDDSSEDEDKEVSFNEEQFARMMREMMGLPSEDALADISGKGKPAVVATEKSQDATREGEDEEIQRLATQIESELRQYGALTLDPGPKPVGALQEHARRSSPGQPELELQAGTTNDDDHSGHEDIDIDYGLAKNLLESFKSQGGMAGPAGNILGLMGMRLPRDEGDEDEGSCVPEDGRTNRI